MVHGNIIIFITSVVTVRDKITEIRELYPNMRTSGRLVNHFTSIVKTSIKNIFVVN